MKGPFAENIPLLSYASGARRAGGPACAPDPVNPGEVYRSGDMLIATDGAVLPRRCILCGAEASGRPLQLTFSWDTSFRMTRASTLQLGRKARVFAPLCDRHRHRWSRGRIIGIGGALACAGLVIAGVLIASFSEASQVPFYALDGIAMVLGGFAGMILFLFWFALRTRTLSCSRIEDGYLYLDGAAAEFLAALPELPVRR